MPLMSAAGSAEAEADADADAEALADALADADGLALAEGEALSPLLLPPHAVAIMLSVAIAAASVSPFFIDESPYGK